MCLLRGTPHFLGCFSSDNMEHIKIKNFPVTIIVNIAESSIVHGHWLSIRLTNQTIEIFDSLGCSPEQWGYYPKTLISFLNHFAYSHSFKTSPVLQSTGSHACGLYCVYFILFRTRLSFRQLVTEFTVDKDQNDLILYNYLRNNT